MIVRSIITAAVAAALLAVFRTPAATLPPPVRKDAKTAVRRAETPDRELQAYISALASETDRTKRYEILLSLGKARLGNRDYEAAIDAFQKAVALFPRREEGGILLAGAYVESDLYELARQAYTDVLSRHRSSFRARCGLGDLYLMQGFAARAMECYRAALAIRPTSDVYRRMASCAEAAGDFDLSVAMLSQIVPRERSYKDNIDLGRLYEKKGRYRDAEDAYARAVGLDSTRVEGYLRLGALYILKDDLAHARRLLEIAREKGPDEGAVGFLLAHVYYRQGEPDRALAELRRSSGVAGSRELSDYCERFEGFLLKESSGTGGGGRGE